MPGHRTPKTRMIAVTQGVDAPSFASCAAPSTTDEVCAALPEVGGAGPGRVGLARVAQHGSRPRAGANPPRAGIGFCRAARGGRKSFGHSSGSPTTTGGSQRVMTRTSITPADDDFLIPRDRGRFAVRAEGEIQPENGRFQHFGRPQFVFSTTPGDADVPCRRHS